jgi:hypothetical protein
LEKEEEAKSLGGAEKRFGSKADLGLVAWFPHPSKTNISTMLQYNGYMSFINRLFVK